MATENLFQANVTLNMRVKVRVIIQAKNIFQAYKSLERVFGKGNIGLVSEYRLTVLDFQNQLLFKNYLS
jgi:hypothetical protein